MPFLVRTHENVLARHPSSENSNLALSRSPWWLLWIAGTAWVLVQPRVQERRSEHLSDRWGILSRNRSQVPSVVRWKPPGWIFNRYIFLAFIRGKCISEKCLYIRVRSRRRFLQERYCTTFTYLHIRANFEGRPSLGQGSAKLPWINHKGCDC